jgi:hypothetical protein
MTSSAAQNGWRPIKQIKKKNKKPDKPVMAWYRMHPNEKMSPKNVYL